MQYLAGSNLFLAICKYCGTKGSKLSQGDGSFKFVNLKELWCVSQIYFINTFEFGFPLFPFPTPPCMQSVTKYSSTAKS